MTPARQISSSTAPGGGPLLTNRGRQLGRDQEKPQDWSTGAIKINKNRRWQDERERRTAPNEKSLSYNARRGTRQAGKMDPSRAKGRVVILGGGGGGGGGVLVRGVRSSLGISD